MNLPLVTVIMIVKNGERFLAQAIESVLAQDYRPLEIVLVDGQSTDQTAVIAKSYPQVRYFRQIDPGIAQAYNEAIGYAQGEILTFLAHDDYWDRKKITTQMDYFRQHPASQLTFTLVQYFLEEGLTPPAGFRPELLTGVHPGMIPETLAAKRELFAPDQVGLFDVHATIAEDIDWFARAIDLNIPMTVISKQLVFKRVYSESTSLDDLHRAKTGLLQAMRKSIRRKRASPKGMPNV